MVVEKYDSNFRKAYRDYYYNFLALKETFLSYADYNIIVKKYLKSPEYFKKQGIIEFVSEYPEGFEVYYTTPIQT